LAGTGVLLFGALAVLHDPQWIAGIMAIAINLLQSGVTNRCGVKALLVSLGFPGERELGRADGLAERSPGQGVRVG
jgi:hypothetical protein